MDFDDFETTGLSSLFFVFLPIANPASHTVKIIVVGNGRVGKTSMTTRYCTGEYTEVYKKTIGEY